MHLRLICVALLTLLAAGPAAAQTGNTAEANKPPDLRRGLNLSNWLANAARQPLDERDFKQIRRAGFDHVRLPVNPEFFGFRFDEKTDSLKSVDFTPVDNALALAQGNRLAVILDIHPGDAFMKTLEGKDWAGPEFKKLWAYLADRYKKYPANMLAFELLNEPQYYRAEDRYAALAAGLVKTIHDISPHRLVIIGAPHGSSIEGLTQMAPVAGDPVAYDFHFYEPYIITHQGIHRGFENKMLRFFEGMPYPSENADEAATYYAPTAPDPDEAEKELQEYVNTPWNAAHIGERIGLARDWAAKNNARVMCGEFGALRLHIDAASRYRWIADVRRALEADQMGWDLWDYADLMGIVRLEGKVSAPDPVDGSVHLLDPAKGKRVFEPEALKALGLAKPNN